MVDSSAPSPPAGAAVPPGAEAAAGAAIPASTTNTEAADAASAASAARAAASAITVPGSTAVRIPAQPSRPDRRPSEAARPSSSRDGPQRDLDQDDDASRSDAASQQQQQQQQTSQQQQLQQPQHSPAPSIVAASTTTPPRRRSFFSRFTLPFRAPARTIADFHIRPAEPHRKYVAGDHVLGAVVLAVVKPVRITHLTVSLRGLVRVFKDPNAAAMASLPTDTATDSSSSATSRLLPGKSSSSSSSSSSYLGNGHALLFRDEMVLSGPGRLEPGNYEFEFDLIFPSQGLPSSIDFERGSICYVVTATLTRPTTVAPIQSCDRRVYLVDPVDIGAVPKPRPRTISLEPISKRSKKRKIVVVTQPPPPLQTNSSAAAQAGGSGVLGAMSTISFASGGGSSDRHEIATLSERGSVRDSAHETIQTEDTELDGYAEAQGRTSRSSQPRSPIPTDIRSEISVESVASGGSETRSGNGSGGFFGAAGGSGSGSGFGSARGPGSGAGAGSNIIRLSSPTGSHAAASTAGHSAATTTGTNTSSSTITNPAAGSSGNGQKHHPLVPVKSVSTTTISGVVDDRTITATIDLLKGGCLPGEVVSVKVSVQHVKRIKSLHGVVVTLYRQGRIDSAPPDYMFSSAGTSIAEEDEGANGSGNSVSNGGVTTNNSTKGHDDPAQPQSRKQKKQKEKEVKDKEKQKERRKDKNSHQRRGSKDKNNSSNGSTKLDNYYPKSKTGLGGLSLMSAGTCSVFRKDLSQSFSPLIIDPRTLQSSVTASVRMPEDAFATIKGVPGDMISFKYQLEVIVDLGGKLANLLQSGVGPAGPNLVSNSSNPYDGKLTSTAALWSGGSNMIDTDQLRRQKGVIFVAFEVVVGTTDTTRQRGRGLKGAADSPQQVGFQQQQTPRQPPQPYISHHPPDWYPEDRKGPYQQHPNHHQPQEPPYPSWPVNGMASGSGVAGPSTAPGGPPLDDHYYHHHHPYHEYNQYPQQPDYNHPNYHHQGPYYDYYDDSRSPSTNSAPHPPYFDRASSSAQAPQYVPTADMLAAERDPNLTEKERIRRAEQRLLPSQPPTAASAANGGEGSSSGTSRYAPTAPSAPSLDELDAHAIGGPSAPPFDDGSPGSSQPPMEDKQELERRRLLAEASAPPEFPEDYDDAGVGSNSRARATRAYMAGVGSSSNSISPTGLTFGGGSGTIASPSAPVLEEEDAHHNQYNQSTVYHHGSGRQSVQASASFSSPSAPSGPRAGAPGPSAPFAPTAEELLGDDADAPSAPPAEDVVSVVEGTTDEDHYGRNYTYGPGTGPSASSSRTAAHTEPLPKYER
ncbi:ph-response sensor protein [Sporothrix bragantina]|uniref:Ph-response sensor protein n=1 Tax=Sporothrix bragantina TaxID=671064 RepID=A0ABP0B9A8_9PEZI